MKDSEAKLIDIKQYNEILYQYVLDKNTVSATIVEEKLNKIQSILNKKGPDIKFERQVTFLNKIKSNLILSWRKYDSKALNSDLLQL